MGSVAGSESAALRVLSVWAVSLAASSSLPVSLLSFSALSSFFSSAAGASSFFSSACSSVFSSAAGVSSFFSSALASSSLVSSAAGASSSGSSWAGASSFCSSWAGASSGSSPTISALTQPWLPLSSWTRYHSAPSVPVVLSRTSTWSPAFREPMILFSSVLASRRILTPSWVMTSAMTGCAAASVPKASAAAVITVIASLPKRANLLFFITI